MENNVLMEYQQSFENWRFLVGLRFIILAFFLTLTSALLYVTFSLPLFKESLYQ